jgi:hypothetical protein
MTLCVKTGYQCVCQPDEGVFCPDYKPDAYVQCLMDAITELRALQSETALTDEKGRPMTYWGGAASPDKEHSSTPRTNAVVARRPAQGLDPWPALVDHARQLERDLTVAKGLEQMAYDQRDKAFDKLNAMQSAVAPITDEWRAAALRLGEQLTTTGPNGYYSMTPTQWLDWCENALPSASAVIPHVNQLKQFAGEVTGAGAVVMGDQAIVEAYRAMLRTADRSRSPITK